MRGRCITEMVLVVAALHGVVLSLVPGLRCLAYLAAAYLCAVAVWGTVAMVAGKRCLGFVAGLGVSVVVQQTAYQAWRAELEGFWWPVAQFFALQWLVGLGVRRVICSALRQGMPDEHEQADSVMVAERREPRWTCL